VIGLPLSRIIAIAGLGLLAANASAQRTYQCYDDDQGRRVCGDALPPEAARFDREVINSQGIRVGREQGEITAEEQREIDERRARETEAQNQAAEKLRYGQALLDSYGSVRDIENVRRRTVEQYEALMSYTAERIADSEETLDDRQRRAQRFSPYNEDAPPLPENLRLEIERTESAIRVLKQRLEDYRKIRDESNEQFEQDIRYYRELTGDV
jgi:chromosome segregation ATPase